MVNPVIESDLQRKIDLQDSDGFRGVFRSLVNEGRQEEASALAIRLLEARVPELHQPIPFRERYEFILDRLKEEFPYLMTYFARSKPGNGLERVVISTKGQRMIFDELRHKGSLRENQVEVKDNFDVFEKELLKVFRSADDQRHFYTLRHRHLDQPRNFTSHTSMVFVEKKENELFVFISDSGGRENSWTQNLLNSVQAVYRESGTPTNLKIYLYDGKKRLHDHTNCPIIAMRDAVHTCQDPDGFRNWVEAHAYQKSDNVYGVSYLPHKMMQMSQSMSLVTNFLQETGTADTLIYGKNKPEGKTLMDAIAKHLVVYQHPLKGGRKEINAKTADLFLKYERMIIGNALILGK